MTTVLNTTTTTSAQSTSAIAIANSNDALVLLDKLHQEQEQWSATLYKTAQDKLIAMLGECMTAYKWLNDDDKQRKLFNARLKALNMEMRAGTDLSTRIVRYVFRLTGGRMHAYARVIREAIHAQKEPAELAAWIAINGGIEGIRTSKSGNKAAKSIERELENATTALEHAGALVSIGKLEEGLQPSSNSYGNFTLLLVRHDKSSGNGAVVWGSDNAALIKRFIGRVAKQVLDKHEKELEATSAPARRAEFHAALTALPEQLMQASMVQLPVPAQVFQHKDEKEEEQAA